jgi:PHD/YefM family antitoxin component YafN of YafNO toxin-antitoxin module
MNYSTTLTASETRENLYSIIKSASLGLKSFIINLRGSDPVVLISQKELESWQETLDILQNKKEITTIRLAKKEKKNISHLDMLKAIGLKA